MFKPSHKRKAVLEKMMRESILEATVEVLKNDGLEGVRMAKIAQTAEMAIGSLYTYFRDKEDLLLYVFEALAKPFYEDLIKIAESEMSPIEKLRTHLRFVFGYFEKHSDIFPILARAQKYLVPKNERDPVLEQRTILIDSLSKIIKEGIQEGSFRPCDPLQAATVIYGVIYGLITAKIKEPGPMRSVEEDVKGVEALLFPGLLK